MNNKFDELAKGLAQSATRRQALKKFGVGLAGLALACFGLESGARAASCKPLGVKCNPKNPDACCSGICSPMSVCPHGEPLCYNPVTVWYCGLS